jgi:hypothetical protein
MSRLESLRDRIEALTSKRARANQVGLLLEYNKTLAEERSRLESVAIQRLHAQSVFPELKLSKVVEDVAKAAGYARRLAATLRKKQDALQDSERRLIEIKEWARSAAKRVGEGWKEVLEKRIDALRPVVRIAVDARLSGGATLDQALRSIGGRPPPNTEEEARALGSVLTGLATSVGNLGLKGAAGDFLQRAAAGTARPKDLEEPEVREVLTRYELWDRLSVRLG